jgi:AraC-like DNA-binding protein
MTPMSWETMWARSMWRTSKRASRSRTGLTRGAIRQIERARQAATLLTDDVAPREVVQRLGYYDQPHLARSLARFIGRTATELRRAISTMPCRFCTRPAADLAVAWASRSLSYQEVEVP